MDPDPRGSRSFHHQAKIGRKTFISTVLYFLRLFIFDEWWKSIKQQKFEKNYFVGIVKVTDEKSRMRICKSVVRIRTKMPRIHNTAVDMLLFYSIWFANIFFIQFSVPLQRWKLLGPWRRMQARNVLNVAIFLSRVWTDSSLVAWLRISLKIKFTTVLKFAYVYHLEMLVLWSIVDSELRHL